MKEKINIAEILKDKPANTKLYSPLFSEVYFSQVRGYSIDVKHHGVTSVFYSSGKFYDYNGSEPLLFPSKEMRNWSKFAWKKCDVLVSNDGKREVLFQTWVNDSYTKFVGLHCLIINDNEEVEYDNGTTVFNTNDFRGIEAENSVQTYINTIEEKLGGTLNRETLEIEKQNEFKDGDIVVTDAVPSLCYSKCIFILKGDLNTDESRANSYVFYNINNNHISFDVLDTTTRDRNIHLATDSEKRQLFDAIEKDGKAWDAEKKALVDLKQKVELKPFDSVLVRNCKSENWRANLFGYIDKDGFYCCVWANWAYCIPYIGNESLLGTTKDVDG